MSSTKSVILLLSVYLLTAACGVVPKTKGMEAGAKGSKNAIETGVASWYGPNFHGKLTANGEVYDMDGMTAAHRTLPFNSEVVVENLDNGRTTRVRINDRGPFAKNRIIDLSRAAATEIGMIGPGTARVRIYLVKGDLENSRVTDLKVANFTIQLGSFSEEILAMQESEKINGSRVEQVTVNGMQVYRVYFGLYQNPDDARNDLEALQADGFDGFVKQVEND
ncbi:MAG: septal ring lytic transglycosylase RlpA family protein [Balneolaceae bacterium]|nr:septal ring lytic transglycosylase RlpA family protein [Balneolaceae bacterium]